MKKIFFPQVAEQTIYFPLFAEQSFFTKNIGPPQELNGLPLNMWKISVILPPPLNWFYNDRPIILITLLFYCITGYIASYKLF